MVLSHENTSTIAQLIPVLYKQRWRHCRLLYNSSDHIACLLTTLYDNVDGVHHTDMMSTNRTEETELN